MTIEPITRKEQFLAKAGGQQVGDLKPITREEMFLSKIGGGGGSSVQPDWNQNDPNAPDFVKNRTHYAETVEATVLEKTTFTELEEELDEDSGATRYYYAEFYRKLTLVDGKTYFITFNGVRYECVYDSYSECLGNLSICDDGDDTGEPFIIDPWGAYTKTDEPFTVVITTMEESVTTIPKKYLPDVGGGENYDIDIVGRDGVWTLVAGSFEDIKTRLINGDVFNCRIRSCSSYNSEAYYAASTTYNMEDEDISISVLGISTATVKVHQVVIRPDNSVGFYYSSN